MPASLQEGSKKPYEFAYDEPMIDEQFLIGFAFGATTMILIMVLFSLGFLVLRPWIRMKLMGGHGSLIQILAMRFRGTPPMLIVNAYTTLLHCGLKVSLHEVESQYVANRALLIEARDLIEHMKEFKQRKAEAAERNA